MRPLLMLLSFLVSSFTLFVVGCAPPEDTSTSRAKIQELDHVFVRAFNSENVDSIMMVYWNNPDVVAMYPDNMCRGYDAIKQSWQNLFNSGDVKKFEITEDRLMVHPDLAYEWGTYNFDYRSNGGSIVSMPGRFLQVWERKNGQWVITADHASPPMPPPPTGSGTPTDTSRRY